MKSSVGTISLMTCLAITLSLVAFPAQAQLEPAAQRGQTFAKVHCAQCHSIDKVSESPLRIAPPFRELLERYPADDLRAAFLEGIVTKHPTMPQYRLELDQAANLIAFIKALNGP